MRDRLDIAHTPGGRDSQCRGGDNRPVWLTSKASTKVGTLQAEEIGVELSVSNCRNQGQEGSKLLTVITTSVPKIIDLVVLVIVTASKLKVGEPVAVTSAMVTTTA